MNSKMTIAAVIAAIAVFALGAGAALAQDVNVNYVPGTDFSGYKTYKWVEIQGAEKPDQILDTQIKQAIDKALAAKGLTKAAGDAADLAIGYQVALTQQQQWNTYSTGGYGARRYGGGMGTATSTTINIGTVALDMYDAAAKELVWKGQASKTREQREGPREAAEEHRQGDGEAPQGLPAEAEEVTQRGRVFMRHTFAIARVVYRF